MISYATPEFLYVILPMILIFLAFQRFYIVTSRQLKRLYSVSKSPLFSHFSETVTGSPVIRAYQQTQRWFFFHINNHKYCIIFQNVIETTYYIWIFYGSWHVQCNASKLPYFWNNNIVSNLHSINFFLLILYFLLLPHNHILMRAKKSELYCNLFNSSFHG